MALVAIHLRCVLRKSLPRKKCAGITSVNLLKKYMGEIGSIPNLLIKQKEFDALLKSAHSELKDVFRTFDQKTDRIDSFYAGIMSESASYKDCWEIFKFVFTLSHGQASIEKGFSINKELLVENLQEESIVCQRMVYDHVNCSGKSITEVPMTNALLESCKLVN